MKTNKVYLVGAGPGDPGLITVKGLEILKQADVVIYDNLVDKRLLDYAKEGAKLICKEKADIKKIAEDKKVVRLKSGDPSIFGRTSQEIDDLIKNKIDYEIIPGVTAGSAAACMAGMPLTDRRFSSSVVFVTGHEANGKNSIDWESIANCGTVVLYMAVKNIKDIAEKLISAGKPRNTPVVVVSDQKVLKTRLDSIEAERISPPAIFIITKEARLKRNNKVLFTGLSKERFFLKDTYVHLPLIKIKPLEDYTEFDNYLENIKEFDWIVFTSRYGVECFFKRLNVRIPDKMKFAVIGNSTKNRLKDYGIIADLAPKEESSKGLLKEFEKINIKNKKIFLPRSDISDKGLEKGLSGQGAVVRSSIAYRNVMPDNLPDLDFDSFKEIMFTSPSGVRNFVKRYGAPCRIKISCIGDVTKREAKKWNLLD